MTRREELAAWLHAQYGEHTQPSSMRADSLTELVDRLCAEAAADALEAAASGIAYAASDEASWGYDDDTQAALEGEAARLSARASALRAAHPTTSEETDHG